MNLQALYDAVLNGDATAARTLTEAAVAEGADPQALLSEAMIPAMDEVGRLFEINEYFVPELLISARAMKSALAILRPLLAASGAASAGRVVIGTVRGDLHDIGKNLVAAMLEGGGFEVVDLGVDVSPEQFVKAVRDTDARIVAMSALLTTTMTGMRDTIGALKDSGLRNDVKVMVGGAPVTAPYAEEIGADGFSATAGGAVRVARDLIPPAA